MAKILFHVSTENQADKSTITKYKNLASGIGNARKVDRLLKSSVEVQKMMDALRNSQGDSLITALTVFSAFCMAMRWFKDNQVFLAKLKVLDNVDIKASNLRSKQYWLVGLVIVMYLFYGKLSKLQQQREEASDQGEVRELERQLFIKKVQGFGYLCDLIIALNDSGQLEKIKGSRLNDGAYGVIGGLSALTVCYRLWPSK